jgi:hypothetical protein
MAPPPRAQSTKSQGKMPMSYPPANPAAPQQTPQSGKAPQTYANSGHQPSPVSSNGTAPHKSRAQAGSTDNGKGKQPNKIWSTNTLEERERIKEFWLGLGEDERRKLVEIEKSTVLRKMKEQQKHSCSCAVCGRKRCVLCSMA